MERVLIKCHGCKFRGTVLQMAFIWNQTLCGKCATKKLMYGKEKRRFR